MRSVRYKTVFSSLAVLVTEYYLLLVLFQIQLTPFFGHGQTSTLPRKVCCFIQGVKGETRKIPVPRNRYAPLKENWTKIFTPIVEHLHLQIKYNLRSRCVEIRVSVTNTKFCCNAIKRASSTLTRHNWFEFEFHARVNSPLVFQTCKQTTDIGALQKAADFVKAFTLGFEADVSSTNDCLSTDCLGDYLRVCFTNVAPFFRMHWRWYDSMICTWNPSM